MSGTRSMKGNDENHVPIVIPKPEGKRTVGNVEINGKY